MCVLHTIIMFSAVVIQMKCELQKSHKSSWKSLSTELTTFKERNRILRSCLMLESNFVCDGFTFPLHLQYKEESSRSAVGLLCVRRLFSWICEEI